MNWIHILLYIPHCRFGVSWSFIVSARKVIAKSLPSRNLLYNAGFYISHCDVSLFLKAKSPNSPYAAFLGLFSSFLKLTHLIGTAQVALVASLPRLVRPKFLRSPVSKDRMKPAFQRGFPTTLARNLASDNGRCCFWSVRRQVDNRPR